MPYAFPSPPPLVRGFQATSLFSPSGDSNRKTATIAFRMNEAGQADVTIKDVDTGKVLRTLTTGPQPAGIVRLEWDGTNDQGEVMPDGEYSVSLHAWIGKRNYRLSRRTIIDRSAPRLGTVSAESAAIAGKGDGQCRVAATALDRGSMTLTAVPASGGDAVATFERAGVADGQSVVWNWDGTATGGAPVAPGVYVIRATLADRARNSSTRTTTCWVGHAIGAAIPPSPRAGTRPRIRLTTPTGEALPPGTRVTLRIARRTADPGGTSTTIVGPFVGATARGPLQTTRITLPRQIPPSRLWIVATTDNARAIIPLRP